MLPAVLFAGDHQTIVSGPVEDAAAGVVGHVGKRTLRRCGTVPNLARLAGRNVGNPNGPRMRAVGLDEVALRRVARLGGTPHEGDAGAVERPCRIDVIVHAWSEKGHDFRRRIVNTDEAVIASAGNKS